MNAGGGISPAIQIPPEPFGFRVSCSLGRRIVVAGLLWLGVLGAGFYLLAREEFTPIAGNVSSTKFPPRSVLALSPTLPTLILFAHPHCPCTRATLREFEELLANVPKRVAATIVFTLPKGVPPHWEQGDLWQSAAKIPGVHVIVDPDGREASRFGVKGSGHVLLYTSSGDLVFNGGITPSRGHGGDNPGSSAIISLIIYGRAAVNRTPVYGCPLLDAPSTPLAQ
jgi:hypothetical protein